MKLLCYYTVCLIIFKYFQWYHLRKKGHASGKADQWHNEQYNRKEVKIHNSLLDFNSTPLKMTLILLTYFHAPASFKKKNSFTVICSAQERSLFCWVVFMVNIICGFRNIKIEYYLAIYLHKFTPCFHNKSISNLRHT